MARVLILEPAHEVRELVARLLTRLGHEPLLAGDFEDAAAARPEVVVVEPADEESLRVARALRAKQPDLPIVCATVLPRGEAADVGFDAYLEKPFHFDDLERVIDGALAR